MIKANGGKVESCSKTKCGNGSLALGEVEVRRSERGVDELIEEGVSLVVRPCGENGE